MFDEQQSKQWLGWPSTVSIGLLSYCRLLSYFNYTAKLNDNSPRYVIRSLIDLLEDDDETIRHECIECISESPAYGR